METNYGKLIGTDVDVEISLCEYGIAWQFSEDRKEIRFWYGIRQDNSGNYVLFDWGCFSTDTDIYNEFDWVDWKDVLDSNGMDKEDFDGMPLELQINDLLRYYGYENVFGSTYSNGFRFNPETEKFTYAI